MGPWLLYQYYGDKRILESFYSSSKGEVDYCIANAETSKFWISSFGDWCSTFGDGTYDKSYSEGELVSTTLYFYITNLLSQIAGILGKTGDSTNYAIKANSILTDFNHRHFNDTTNTYGNGKQITYIMPMLYGMVPSDKESAVFRNLLNNVVERSMGHFGTGIYGTSFLLDILCDYGRPDVVYTLLNKTTYPSFGDQIVNHSATTTWEQWGVISTGKEMETYDHAMFSGADKTFYTKFAGIRPLTPGYKTISIKPVIPDSLTYVNSSVKTVRGVIYSNWDKFDGVYIHNISIPVNTTAIVYIPGNNSRNVYENGIPASEAVGIHYMRTENNYIVYKVESGSYYFSYGKPIKQVESLLNHQSYNEQYWWHRVGMAFIKD
jgi:alpha-L-rhamnosidase